MAGIVERKRTYDIWEIHDCSRMTGIEYSRQSTTSRQKTNKSTPADIHSTIATMFASPDLDLDSHCELLAGNLIAGLFQVITYLDHLR